MNALSTFINTAIILCVGAELFLLLRGNVSADQLLVTSVVSGLLVIVSLKLVKQALAQVYGLTETQKTSLKNELDIMEVVNSHIQLKTSLQQYLAGTSNKPAYAGLLGHDDQCPLCKWLQESTFASDSEGIRKLRNHHMHFHSAVDAFFKAYDANDRNTAQKLLREEVNFASHHVVRSLTELNQVLA